MNQVAEFFSRFFSSTEWPPRWNCGYWTDFHGWLYIFSDLMIWLAYFLIPVIILNYLNRKKTALKFNTAYVYFAAFILLCGSTHFLDAVMFWVPMYRLNAIVRLATALVSLATVYHLIKILPEAFQQKTNVELEREIRRRHTVEMQLAESNHRLALANRELEAFAYVVSHDLQEPLRKVRTFSGMLIDENLQHFNERSKELATKVTASAERMQRMINDVLTLSTISNNIELETVSLNQAVKDALEDLEIRIQEKKAVITVGELPVVKGNITYLTQLFSNLLSNSIKFSETRPEIRISGTVTNGQALITFEDNGIGMDQSDLVRIFDPFHRLHSKQEYEGTGIGLAICKRIVQVHQGSITATSEPGRGTTFKIVLPAASADV